MTSTQARFDRWALVFGLARQARIYQQARIASYAAGPQLLSIVLRRQAE